VREAEECEPHPCAAVIDSQEVVKRTPVGGAERGYDGAKRLVAGRKRHILVDTNGLVLAAAQVHGANLPDQDGGRRWLAEDLQRELPRMQWFGPTGRTRAVCASGPKRSEDGGRGTLPSRLAALALRALEEKPRGLQVLARRWVVERTFSRGWVCRVGSAKTTNVC
jgi:hypothetical protein